MGSRRRGRILAVQALYSWDMSDAPLEDLTSLTWSDDGKAGEGPDEATSAFARLLITGTIEKIEEVDRIIRKRLENWDFRRLAKVDLAILRMSVYCLLFQKDIPSSVVIDEAIDISKDFGSEDSYRFINGVLDGIRKMLGNEEA